tara:strand:- start:113 stop:322 length:210 start_codon:yes stop_codon:yes gene_type:complete
MIDSPAGILAGDMLTFAYVFIACGVWSLLMGAMVVSCYLEDVSEEEYESLGNEQWQRDMDEMDNDNFYS